MSNWTIRARPVRWMLSGLLVGLCVGQLGSIAYGTAGIVTTTALTGVPGLSQTVTVPANSVLVVSTDGGLAPNTAATVTSVVDVVLLVDDVQVRTGRRVVATNTPASPGLNQW